jgi:ATP diphosphatase
MSTIEKLLEIMTALRDPDGGCPWDREQTFGTIAPYTIEEAYEVADAIGREDFDDLRDELGDLLFQVVFHAEMAREIGAFDFSAVVDAIVTKMIRRHPHVFGSETIGNAAEQTAAWEAHKRGERAASGKHEAGALTGVGLALPALARAQKLGKRASTAGFDWPDADGVRQKIDEELGEIDAARHSANREQLAEELGDLLFTVVNMARHLGINAEEALRSANHKFERRFRTVELRIAAQGGRMQEMSASELEAEWQAAKAAE